ADCVTSEIATQRLVGRCAKIEEAVNRGAVGRIVNEPHAMPKQHELISPIARVADPLAEEALNARHAPELYVRHRTVQAASDKELAGRRSIQRQIHKGVARLGAADRK